MHVNVENLLYFARFRVEHIGKKITILIGNKNINANTYKMQVFDSVMCGYVCIGFIDFMLKSKSLLVYTNLSFPNENKKNEK